MNTNMSMKTNMNMITSKNTATSTTLGLTLDGVLPGRGSDKGGDEEAAQKAEDLAYEGLVWAAAMFSSKSAAASRRSASSSTGMASSPRAARA